MNWYEYCDNCTADYSACRHCSYYVDEPDEENIPDYPVPKSPNDSAGEEWIEEVQEDMSWKWRSFLL